MKVYLQKPGVLHDKLLGRVEQNGRVYRTHLGPDDEIGHVHLESGKVYLQRMGNDDYIGRVDLKNGKGWRDVTGGAPPIRSAAGTCRRATARRWVPISGPWASGSPRS